MSQSSKRVAIASDSDPWLIIGDYFYFFYSSYLPIAIMAAAARYTSEMYNDIQKLTDVKSGVKNGSPVFYALDGLSQSEKDRFMNYRTVRPPKNIDLLEGDDSGVTSHNPTAMNNFPSEHSLSSKIKEANGMDHSNYAIERHFQRSISASPEVNEESTYTASSVNESSFCTENVLPDNQKTNDCTSAKTIDLKKCRYSKNAAIMGLLRNNIIPIEALISDKESDDHFYPETISPKIEPSTSSSNKEEAIGGETGKSDSKDLNEETKKNPNYPQLVPHPEDPDIYTHPVQAHGILEDSEIDYKLPRKGTKNTTTPRQQLIRDTLDDKNFEFKSKNRAAAPKAKSNFSFPSMLGRITDSSLDTSRVSSAQSDTFNPFVIDNSGTFSMNDNEFPNLGK
ncbi:uncharacterized protein LOC107226280 isoform X1 [Neodiprion lecontei]|uniref:Uncharacterized protein LOC107226280 isoform X1 n=2 Tax=Neodiprion lecontei TaxID=441921 RepID=A0ABM3G8M5_NEOLC|nr:uncharacterized protein LOC107226280 isoform X1 [Neodiprion lecontei]